MKLKKLLLVILAVFTLAVVAGLTLETLNKREGEKMAADIRQGEIIEGVTFQQAVESFTGSESTWAYINGRVYIASYGEEHCFQADVVADKKTGDAYFKNFMIDFYYPTDKQEMAAILYDLARNAK